jgi:pimeloyl-ACP methyl ester carboxylesterase
MKKATFIINLVSWLVLFLLGTGSLLAGPGHEAGFFTLEENQFYFHRGSYFNRLVLQSSRARIWHIFQPADTECEQKPVFVFFNGGPGASTSCGLFGANTSQYAVSKDIIGKGAGAKVVENSSSWTRLGNLLYIDSRTAGFSYSIMENPGDENRRLAEFEAQNYNSFIDGADFIRVLLRFLAGHPNLQHSRVIIVGESYGGTRAIVMLHILLHYRDYGNGRAIYQDPALVQEIQDHYNVVFPGYRDQVVPPGVIAGQFSHQVLIQPALTYMYQGQAAAELLETPGSVVFQLAEETGVPYIPCSEKPGSGGNCDYRDIIRNIYDYVESVDRDLYHFALPGNALNDYFGSINDKLVIYDSLCVLTGVDVASIPEMYASARQNAYKKSLTDNTIPSPLLSDLREHPQLELLFLARPLQADETDLVSRFGVLSPWDNYCISRNDDANTAFYYNIATFYGYDIDFSVSRNFGVMFLENVAWVNTFITNAYYDLVVYTNALPIALARYNEILTNSQHDLTGPPGEVRPGQIVLYYQPGVIPGWNLTTRIIRFPLYTRSGHAVTMTEPGEILLDVTSWLGSTGVTIGPNQGGEK